MKNLTIEDAAKHFGISKEAIHNRIRRGSLEVIMQEGVKFVQIDPLKAAAKPRAKATAATRNSSNDERYYKLLQEQNEKLQARVEKLEGETRSLRDQKEQMLIEERQKIEQIYKDKDAQLKQVLNTLATQFMLTQAPQSEEKEIAQTVEIVDVEEVEEETSEIISLKKYLKNKKLSERKSEKIRKRFMKKASSDERIITVGSKLYIDPVKYDYSDFI